MTSNNRRRPRISRPSKGHSRFEIRGAKAKEQQHSQRDKVPGYQKLLNSHHAPKITLSNAERLQANKSSAHVVGHESEIQATCAEENSSSKNAVRARWGTLVEGIGIIKPPPQTYEQKKETTRTNWDTIISNGFTRKYVECYKNGGPDPSACAPTMIAPSCCCSISNVITRDVKCIYFTGIQDVKVTFCKCTPDPFILLDNHLFPASPSQPRVAFHLSLLALYSELRAEGNLSFQAFAAAFAKVNKFGSPDTIRKPLASAYSAYMRVKENVDREAAKDDIENGKPQ